MDTDADIEKVGKKVAAVSSSAKVENPICLFVYFFNKLIWNGWLEDEIYKKNVLLGREKAYFSGPMWC